MTYQPRHFEPWELLPGLSGNETWATLDPNLRALLSDVLLETCDEVRDLLDVVCTVNNYARGGDRQWCGYRPPRCTVGVPRSFHRLGMAADLHPIGMMADEARRRIRGAVAAGNLRHLAGSRLACHGCTSMSGRARMARFSNSQGENDGR